MKKKKSMDYMSMSSVQEKISEIQNKIDQYDDNVITDEKLVEMIRSSSVPTWFLILVSIGIVVAGMLCVARFGTTDLTDTHIMFMVLGLIAVCILVCTSFTKYMKKVSEPFAREHYIYSVYYKTEYSKLTANHGKNRTYYTIRFTNEFGKKTTVEIERAFYKKLKSLPSTQEVYVLRLDKYEKGYVYKVFDIDAFCNKSSAKETTKERLSYCEY